MTMACDPFSSPTALTAAADRGYDEAVERVLDFARDHLKMDVAWMSAFTGDQQVFEHVSAERGANAPAVGESAPLDGSYCIRVLDGRIPSVIRAAKRDLDTRDLAVTGALDIGAYIGVPITRETGAVHGMLCCIAHDARPELANRDKATLELLAQMLGELADRGPTQTVNRHELREQVVAAIEGETRHIVLQPVVDITTGRAVAVEALTRFDDGRGPDRWLSDAASVGLRIELELACLRTAFATLDRTDVPRALSVNLSPAALLSPLCGPLLASVDRSRLVIEITEDAPVEDYPALNAALASHRAAGARVAIDDAGAGYASFRHILRLAPEFIKVDLAIIRDIDTDRARQALITALVGLARNIGARIVAEGVETLAELLTLHDLDVELVQGYLFSRPVTAPPLDGYLTTA